MIIRTGTATREGSKGDNADAAYVYEMACGAIGAAVIDGIGHGPHTSTTAPLLAQVAARIAGRRGPLAGLLSAADLVADDGADGREADAVAVAACVHPDGRPTRIAWCGDVRAYGWDGATLTRYTTDQTMGQWVRLHKDVPVEIAEHHDAWVRVSLSTAVVATVREVDIPDPLIILTSDGVHDQTDHVVVVGLVRAHADDPQALAEALVAAATDADGYRDDATVVAIRITDEGTDQ